MKKELTKTEDIMQKALVFHRKYKGKIGIRSKVPLKTLKDLSMAYTPGVAQPSLAITTNPSDIYKYTSKGHLIAIVTDGSAVLGLGNIGAAAALPVMEGKAVLFKRFANIDAFPVCISTQDVDHFVDIVTHIASPYGGINLEDISAPRCFEIEKKLKAALNIPVFHDDQHGTAIVVLAALQNALTLAEKKREEVKITVVGAGAAGTAVTNLLLDQGVRNIVVCDRTGILINEREYSNQYLKDLAQKTNPHHLSGQLEDAMKNSDVFIGVSSGNIVSNEMVQSMNEKPIVFAMANPMPEIMPHKAKEAGAFIIATGRSDYPNQVNNALAFPGVFKGTLRARAKDINMEMKLAAAEALAACIPENELKPDYIIPSPFNPLVVKNVSEAVRKAAVASHVARI
ncbi:NAD-dependent malic enzyme [Candidatus Micrarchaeota archaeon]|nr:NAD-dependent malic enzyme [Candidatus Micrarchaeota archaeon]